MKIDGVLLRSAAAEPLTLRFIDSAVALAKELSLDIVGEGVETRLQCELALRAGISIVQGFYFSRPMPAAEISGFLAGARRVFMAS